MLQLYESNNESTVAAGLIKGPCEVLPPTKFKEANEKRNDLGTEASKGSHPLFLCKYVFFSLLVLMSHILIYCPFSRFILYPCVVVDVRLQQVFFHLKSVEPWIVGKPNRGPIITLGLNFDHCKFK